MSFLSFVLLVAKVCGFNTHAQAGLLFGLATYIRFYVDHEARTTHAAGTVLRNREGVGLRWPTVGVVL